MTPSAGDPGPRGGGPGGRADARRPAVALTIAGSDSGGGAGIQADLKTFHAFGVFGTSALTAITAQNTRGYSGVQRVEPDLVRKQVLAVAVDLAPAACKTGMLVDGEVIRAVAGSLEETEIPAFVLDPVMVAQSGDRLLEGTAVEALREELLPRADLVTPNLEEARILSGRPLASASDMDAAAEAILDHGPGAVLVKGGHLEGGDVVDVLVHPEGRRAWRGERVETRNTHGTGCTLSAAVAAGLAVGRGLEAAVDAAIGFTRDAVRTAPDLGHGAGPLNHWAAVPE